MEEKMVEWATKFESIVVEKMPEAVELGFLYIQINALVSIILGLTGLVAASFFYYQVKALGIKAYRRVRLAYCKNQDLCDLEKEVEFEKECKNINIYEGIVAIFDYHNADFLAPWAINITLLAIGAIIAMVNLLNIWNWITLISPKLGLVHQLLNQV